MKGALVILMTFVMAINCQPRKRPPPPHLPPPPAFDPRFPPTQNLTRRHSARYGDPDVDWGRDRSAYLAKKLPRDHPACEAPPGCCCDSCYPCDYDVIARAISEIKDSPPIRPPRTRENCPCPCPEDPDLCDMGGDGSRMSLPSQDSDKLLIGKLISQGSSRSELVGAARQQGVGPSQIEEVKGHEVAESSRQHVEPQNELAIGTKIKEYQQNPQDAQLRMDIGGTGRMAPIVHVPRAHGKVLDNDVKTGKYVPNPIKVLGEIKAKGGDIETVEGEVVAGDAGDVDVVDFKDSEIEARVPCNPPCLPGETCCHTRGMCSATPLC